MPGMYPSNAIWAGPVSALRWGAVVGLCSRWKAVDLLQRACGAMDLGDCTVEKWGFYADPVLPEALFDFYTGNLADW